MILFSMKFKEQTNLINGDWSQNNSCLWKVGIYWRKIWENILSNGKVLYPDLYIDLQILFLVCWSGTLIH